MRLRTLKTFIPAIYTIYHDQYNLMKPTDELAKASSRHSRDDAATQSFKPQRSIFLHASENEAIAKIPMNNLLIDDENVVWLSPNSHRSMQGRSPGFTWKPPNNAH
jgi:hypothetical protein